MVDNFSREPGSPKLVLVEKPNALVEEVACVEAALQFLLGFSQVESLSCGPQG